MILWVMGFRQRVKAAMILVAVLIFMILGNVWEKNSMTDLNASFSSIYEDRLLPATYIFHLTDRLYEKRIALESLESGRASSADQVESQLNHHSRVIDTLISDFQDTYLVKEESASLYRFVEANEKYRTLENEILNKIRQNQNVDGELATLKLAFSDTKTELTKLSSIQTAVGHDLTAGSENKFASVDLMTTLEISLIVILCFLIEFLVLRTRELPPDPKKYKLN